MILSLLICSLACGALVAPLACAANAEVESTPHVSVVKRDRAYNQNNVDVGPSTPVVSGDVWQVSLAVAYGSFYTSSGNTFDASEEFAYTGCVLQLNQTAGAGDSSSNFTISFLDGYFLIDGTYTAHFSVAGGFNARCYFSVNTASGYLYFYVWDDSYNAVGSYDGSSALVYSTYTTQSSQSGSTYYNIWASTPEFVTIPDAMTSNPVGIVQSIVEILVAGITELGEGLGIGISSFVNSLAFADGSLSIYFIMTIVFGGIALAVGLTTKIFNWLTNLGN